MCLRNTFLLIDDCYFLGDTSGPEMNIGIMPVTQLQTSGPLTTKSSNRPKNENKAYQPIKIIRRNGDDHVMTRGAIYKHNINMSCQFVTTGKWKNHEEKRNAQLCFLL